MLTAEIPHIRNKIMTRIIKIYGLFLLTFLLIACGGGGGGGSNPVEEEIPVSLTGPVPVTDSADLANTPLHAPFSTLDFPYGFSNIKISTDGIVTGYASLEASEDSRLLLADLVASTVKLLTPNDVSGGEYTSSRNAAVYLKDGTLYSIDSSDPIIISSNDNVERFWLTANDTKVLYLANDITTWRRNSLYIVDVTGRNRTKLGLSDSNSFIQSERGASSIETHMFRPQLTPDMTRVIYAVNIESTGLVELHSAKLDGTGDVVLNNNIFSSGDDNELDRHFVFTITPDSSRVIYAITTGRTTELYSIAPDGTGNINISGVMVSADDGKGNVISGSVVNAISPFILNITQDSSRVLFLANKEDISVVELFSVAPDGTSLIKISNGQSVNSFVSEELSGSNTVIYGANEIYSVPLSGGTSTQLSSGLSVTGISQPTLTSDKSTVVYTANDSVTNQTGLYAATLDATSTMDLTGAMVAGSELTSFMVDPSSDNIVYRADAEIDNDYAIYNIKQDGTGRQKISPDRLHNNATSSELFGFYNNKFYFSYDQSIRYFTELYTFDLNNNGLENVSATWPQFINEDIDAHSYRQNSAGTAKVFSTNASQFTDASVQVINNGVTCRIIPPVNGYIIDTPVNVSLVPSGNDMYYTLLGVNGYEFYKATASNCATTIINDGVTDALERFKISADELNIVYTANNGDLFSASSDGATTQALNAGRTVGGVKKINNGAFAISPDSSRAVYWADQDTAGVNELYSVTMDGVTTNKINAALVAGGQVYLDGSTFTPKITADNQWIVYKAQQDGLLHQLYKSRLDGTENTLLTDTLVDSVLFFGTFVESTKLSNDSSTVVYLTRNNTTQARGIHASNLTGVATTTQLTQAFSTGGGIIGGDSKDFMLTSNSNSVVYIARDALDNPDELYVVNIDGTGLIKLNTSLVAGGDVEGFNITSDDSKVVYRANLTDVDVVGLYSSNIDGSSKTLLVDNISRIKSSNYERPRLTSDGRVAYRKVVNGVDGIYIMPVTGGTATLIVEVPADRQIKNVYISNNNTVDIIGDLRKLGVDELFNFDI